MASSSISLFPHTNLQQRKLFAIERRPRTLKDFLNENSNSCSSSGFKSFPRQPFQPNVIDFKPRDSKGSSKIQRHRSKAASSTTISSAFQAVINAVIKIPFTTVKSPSFLPRSLSRRLSKKEMIRNQEKANQGKIITAVRIKDIIRWTSFRDLVDQEISAPLDFTPSPNHHCITTTSSTTGSTDSGTSACNSHGSSWCDSDFTAQLSPSWRGNSNSKGFDGNEIDDLGKIQNSVPCVGRDSKEGIEGAEDYNAVGPKEGELLLNDDENEQQSPVSVLDFHFREDENPFSTFDQSLASMKRTKQKLMQKINWFECLAKLEPVDLDKWTSMEESDDSFEEEGKDEIEREQFEVEERERGLLYHVKETSSAVSYKADVDQLLLDFFKYELSERNNQTEDDDFNYEMVSIAKAWMNGEHEALDWGLEHKREAYIRHMHKVEKWSKFEDEQEELALEIEAGILNYLVDEILVDYS